MTAITAFSNETILNHRTYNRDFDVKWANLPDKDILRDIKMVRFERHLRICNFIFQEFQGFPFTTLINNETGGGAGEPFLFIHPRKPDLVISLPHQPIFVCDVGVTSSEEGYHRVCDQKQNHYADYCEQLRDFERAQGTNRNVVFQPYIFYPGISLETLPVSLHQHDISARVLDFYERIDRESRDAITQMKARAVDRMSLEEAVASDLENRTEVPDSIFSTAQSKLSFRTASNYWSSHLGVDSFEKLMEAGRALSDESSKTPRYIQEFFYTNPEKLKDYMYPEVNPDAIEEYSLIAKRWEVGRGTRQSKPSIPIWFSPTADDWDLEDMENLSKLLHSSYAEGLSLFFKSQPESTREKRFKGFPLSAVEKKERTGVSAPQTLTLHKDLKAAVASKMGSTLTAKREMRSTFDRIGRGQLPSKSVDDTMKILDEYNKVAQKRDESDPSRYFPVAKESSEALESLWEYVSQECSYTPPLEDLLSAIKGDIGDPLSVRNIVWRESLEQISEVLPLIKDKVLGRMMEALHSLVKELVSQEWSHLRGVRFFKVTKGCLVVELPGSRVTSNSTTRPFFYISKRTHKDALPLESVWGGFDHKTEGGREYVISSARNLSPSQVDGYSNMVAPLLGSTINFMSASLTPSVAESDSGREVFSEPNSDRASEQTASYFKLCSLIKLFSSGSTADLLSNLRYATMFLLSTHAKFVDFSINKIMKPPKNILDATLLYNFNRVSAISHQYLKVKPSSRNQVTFLRAPFIAFPELVLENSQCLVESIYFQFFASKMDATMTTAKWASVGTLMEMESMYSEFKKESWRLDPDANAFKGSLLRNLGKTKGFTFSPAMAYSASRSLFSDRQSEVSEAVTDFIQTLSRKKLSEFFTTKKSLGPLPELRNQLRAESVLDLCKDADWDMSDFFRNCVYCLTEPTYVRAMIKPEFSGDREAFIGRIEDMTYFAVMEMFASSICKRMPEEFISKRGDKKNILINENLNKVKTKAGYTAIDKTKWNMMFTLENWMCFLAGMVDFVPEEILRFLYVGFAKLAEKEVFYEIPCSMEFMVSVLTEGRSLSPTDLAHLKSVSDIQTFIHQYRSRIDWSSPLISQEMLYLRDNMKTKFLRVEWGFLAGFVNFFSSLYHVAATHLTTKVSRLLGIDVVFSPKHSDDGAAVVTSNSLEATAASITYNKIRRLIEESCQMHDSEKKVFLSEIAFEFMSVFVINMRTTPCLVKFIAPIDDALPFTGYIHDITAASSVCAELYRRGATDVVATSCFILFQFSIRRFYSGGAGEVDSLQIREAREEVERLTLPDTDLRFLKRSSAEGVLKTILSLTEFSGVRLTMIPPQVFGFCPLTASLCLTTGLTSWYMAIWQYGIASEKRLCVAVIDHPDYTPEEETDAELEMAQYSPGTLPIPSINLRYASGIDKIRKKYEAWREKCQIFIDNPILSMCSYDDKETQLALCVSRFFSRGFRESMSYNSFIKKARCYKSQNSGTILKNVTPDLVNHINDFCKRHGDTFYWSLIRNGTQSVHRDQTLLEMSLKTFSDQDRKSTYVPFKYYIDDIFKFSLTILTTRFDDMDVSRRFSWLSQSDQDSFASLFENPASKERLFSEQGRYISAVLTSGRFKHLSVITRLIISHAAPDFFEKAFGETRRSFPSNLLKKVQNYTGELPTSLSGFSSKGFSPLQCQSLCKDLVERKLVVYTKSPRNTLHGFLTSNAMKGFRLAVANSSVTRSAFTLQSSADELAKDPQMYAAWGHKILIMSRFTGLPNYKPTESWFETRTGIRKELEALDMYECDMHLLEERDIAMCAYLETVMCPENFSMRELLRKSIHYESRTHSEQRFVEGRWSGTWEKSYRLQSGNYVSVIIDDDHERPQFQRFKVSFSEVPKVKDVLITLNLIAKDSNYIINVNERETTIIQRGVGRFSIAHRELDVPFLPIRGTAIGITSGAHNLPWMSLMNSEGMTFFDTIFPDTIAFDAHADVTDGEFVILKLPSVYHNPFSTSIFINDSSVTPWLCTLDDLSSSRPDSSHLYNSPAKFQSFKRRVEEFLDTEDITGATSHYIKPHGLTWKGTEKNLIHEILSKGKLQSTLMLLKTLDHECLVNSGTYFRTRDPLFRSPISRVIRHAVNHLLTRPIPPTQRASNDQIIVWTEIIASLSSDPLSTGKLGVIDLCPSRFPSRGDSPLDDPWGEVDSD